MGPAHSGGGSEAGFDASGTYDLSPSLSAIEPHPNQGWHVKLTVHADGSQGAETKHKVFWVSGCAPPPTTSTDDDEHFDHHSHHDDHDDTALVDQAIEDRQRAR